LKRPSIKSGHEASPFGALKSVGRESSHGLGKSVERGTVEVGVGVTGSLDAVFELGLSVAVLGLRSKDVDSSSSLDEVLLSLSPLDCSPSSDSLLRLNSWLAATNRPLAEGICVSRLRGAEGSTNEAGAVICDGKAVVEAETVEAREARMATAEKTRRLRVAGLSRRRRVGAVEARGRYVCDMARGRFPNARL
jgi:hypothetical protein